MRDPPVADPRFEQVNSAVAAAKSLRASPHDQFTHPATSASFGHTAPAQLDYADRLYDDEPQIDTGIADRAHNAHRAGAEQGGHEGHQGHVGHENENYFLDGAAVPADDRSYDDPPRSRATNGLLTVMVLVGCGILGTAGAYGYRTYYSGVRPTDAPIISAEKSPNKMVPAPADSGKSIQERLGEKAANERVVTRQEEPVTFADPNGPRVVLPAPFTTSPGQGPAVQSSPSGQSGAASEPKKVRTVAIRPDGVDPATKPVSGAGLPLQTAPSQPVAATRQPPPPAAKPVSPPRNGGGPLSLEPGQTGETASSYQPAARERAPSAPPASPPRLASTSTSTAAAGGYVVQISSQRSEADAQASIHSLQSKFPKELGDREATVRRADLGPKGIYYRAMVGPFGSAGDADQFCSGLKSAGGQCIVQKN
jgi:hypothetical protein